MKNLLYMVLFLTTTTVFAQTTDYEKGWQALNENKSKEAEAHFAKAMTNPATFADAYIASIYLKGYTGKESSVTDFGDAFYSKVANPYPYIYALWFNSAVLGGYSKKEFPHQEELAKRLIADEKAPGTLNEAANYHMGMHHLYSNEIKKAKNYYESIHTIRNWQYVGPFENLSQSGFYKNYGPLEHPEATAVFKSLTNADVKWFTPSTEIYDGWIPLCYQFNRETAVTYAQNFVQSDKDQSVFLNVGFSGSIKVWLNDQLLIAEHNERTTEMDSYSVKCNLKKGTNRLLVQLGFTNSSYPNFTIRFTDENYKVVPGITGSVVYAPYTKATGSTPELRKQFAEAFFEKKVEAEPRNFINHLLLADAYLRSNKYVEARTVISKALELAPNNSMLRVKLVEALGKDNNRTLILEEIEKLKKADPESYLVMELDLKEMLENEKYDDLSELLKKRVALYGEDLSSMSYNILLLIHESKYNEMVTEVEKLYAKYPNNTKYLKLMYTIKKDVYKNKKAALQLYENFFKNNYHYDTYINYSKVLAEDGNEGKALDVLKLLADYFPYTPAIFYRISDRYFSAKKYKDAEENTMKSIALSPYDESYWKQLGDIKSEVNEKEEALKAYNKSLQFNPNQYTLINQIRKLNNKPEYYKFFPETDVEKLIAADKPDQAKNTDYGYYFIHDQKDVIIYPEGATEEYITYIIRITNDKGVEKYKESSIGYGNNQSLLIEKADIIKKNGTKIEGERNENEIVFTNLEAGDIVIFKYRLQSYVYGRFAKEYWDTYHIGGQIYTNTMRYNILTPTNYKLSYEYTMGNVKPVIKDIENFKLYSWEVKALEPLKEVPLSPMNIDIGQMLHVSSIQNWSDISGWYSDVSNTKAEEDIEIINLHKKLFENEKSTSQFAKAKKIYDYIASNIKYSSVSFRQSAFVPQRPSKTLVTRLGDCKDLSSLFVTLAQMSGIPAQMVLVSTYNNGEKSIVLPSVEFNHCIVKTNLDGKDYYLELTDNYLPFASLPNNLNRALILEIPSKTITTTKGLQPLLASSRTKDVMKRIMEIKVDGTDLKVNVKTLRYGASSSSTRSVYLNLDKEKQIDEMHRSISGDFKNVVKVNDISFKYLNELRDSVEYEYNYTVKDEVSEIGALSTFKIAFPDVVASLDKFSEEKRDYPVNYIAYEDADAYETTVTILAPVGKKFVELPTNQSFAFGNMKYSIQYALAPAGNKLVVTRKFYPVRENVGPEKYPAMKEFFEKAIKAEKKFIAFK